MNTEKLRRETPGCHNKLFFNSAGSSLPPESVNQAVRAWLDEEEQEGGYRLAARKKRDIAGFYHEVGLLLNASARNIAFVSSATDAYARALSSIPFREGDIILTSDDDYVSSHLQFLSMRKRFGIRIMRTKTLENGDLDLDHMRELMSRYRPRLVSLAHIPTSSGLIQDAVAVGDLCEEFDSIYMLDACQSAGQLPLDVHILKCHFLSATGRKFLRGPRGTGFLYVADQLLRDEYAPLFIDLQGATWTGPESYELGKNARRFEQWEMPYALMMGLKAAIGYASGLGMEEILRRNSDLSGHLRHRLEELKDVEVYDRGTHLGSIVTFRKAGRSLQDHQHVLQGNNVFFSVSTKESAQYDFERKNVDALIRLSPHYFNTRKEIDDLVEIIATI